MSCRYHFIVTQHTADGIKAAMHRNPSGADNSLIIVATEDSGCALNFGCVMTEGYLGIAGLLRYDASELLVRVENGGRQRPVIFPNASKHLSRPYAELLDSVRPLLRKQEEATVILRYDRLSLDLPPLEPEDTLAAFWEVRDFVMPAHVEAFQYLRERDKHEEFDFKGLQLYSRLADYDEDIRSRADELSQLIGAPAAMDILTFG